MKTKTNHETAAVLAAPSQSGRAGASLVSPGSILLEPARIPAPPTPSSRAGACPSHQELWDLYHQQADAQTENALVESYLPLVRAVLGRLSVSGSDLVDQDDLHSAGVVGLLQALRHYKPASGVPFESYARHRIRGAIFDELRRTDWVPRSVHEKAKRVFTASSQLEQELGRAPTERELARALNLSVSECSGLLKEVRPAQFIHLDSPAGSAEEGAENLHECFAPAEAEDTADQVARRELQQVIFERLKQMPQTQRQVLTLYYIEDLNLREIAVVLKLTESRICQIHSQAIESVRAYMDRFEKGLAGCAKSAA